MHGFSVRNFQREVTEGCKIENVTGKWQVIDFKTTLTGKQFHQRIHRWTRSGEDSNRKFDFDREVTGGWFSEDPNRRMIFVRSFTESLILTEICQRLILTEILQDDFDKKPQLPWNRHSPSTTEKRGLPPVHGDEKIFEILVSTRWG